MKSLGSRLGRLWCQVMHPAPMWPVKGYYQCPACFRSYPVPWEHVVCSNGKQAAMAVSGDSRADAVGPRSAVAALVSTR